MDDVDLVAGRATPEGTRRFADRFPDRPGHFRCPDRLWLSSIGLGMRRGEPLGVDDLRYRSAVPLLLQGGVNVFDTALSERMQASERNLGTALRRAFREGEAVRDEVFVATKGGYLTVDPDLVGTRDAARRYLMETYVESGLVDLDRVAGGVYCLEPAFLRDQIRRSRHNLGLETIDLYCLESPEILLQEVGTNEFRKRLCAAFEVLERAVDDGHIGAYGLASWEGLLVPHTERVHLSVMDLFEWVLEVGSADHHLRALQLPYSLAMTEALRLESQLGPTGATAAVLGSLRGTGTAVFASAPLVGGRALGRVPPYVRDALPELRTDAQRCLQFVRSTAGVTSAIVGMREPEHIEENLAVTRVAPAPPERIEALFKRAVESDGGGDGEA